ncbi:MAG TPA: M91 family zinc metallopeptidase [Terriglobia bacterium]|nr:M91 family zinc metallopeptidase [Terriglobia bacterium]
MAEIELEPGIFIRYEPTQNPYFAVIVIEALKNIKTTATGTKLLKKISAAAPSSVPADFPGGCKVLILPTTERIFIPQGFRRAFGELVANPGDKSKRPFNPTKLSGSCAYASDVKSAQVAAGKGGGSGSTLEFNNTVTMTSRGETAHPFIVLAHELIHAYHALYGTRKDGPAEELWTTGIQGYEDEEITENKIRKEAGIPERAEYYS